MPIHNEEFFLPFSLPSMCHLKPTEVILLFDHCSDNSKKVARQIMSRYNLFDKTLFVDVNSWESGFQFTHSYLRFYGSKLASNNIVLFTAADMILDKKIIHYVKNIGNDNVGFISFIHKNYPVDWRLLIKRLLVTFKLPGLGSERWLGAIMLYNRKYGFDLEDLGELKNLAMAQDTHLRRAISKKHKTLCFNSNTLHLRPMESKRHYLRGKLYWIDLHRSFLVTLLSSVMMLRFNLLKGYIHARFGEVTAK